jgi:predicted nucleotidyltransferase
VSYGLARIIADVDQPLDRDLAAFFENDPHSALAVYLFGSEARGSANAGSDVDVAVLFAAAPASTFDAQPFGLEGELERRLGRPIDVVVLNTAPVDLRIRVLREGRLIFERDRSSRIRFEVRTRNEAFDLEPILREYRTAARRR